ncbi:MAG: PAS domain-containing protein, partial [Pseudomonadales bacterium]|nr:PAS domain-containing protein [Pseudomonadales bacterium]
MRKTGAVTGTEVRLAKSDELVSATDTKGVITFANEAFCRIAKYTSDELLGQAHNLLRHPDMPSAAFKSLWHTIQTGDSWLGVVKNRCKNGDHYWVSAHVTPALQNGKVVGYESVRSPASLHIIARAESCYKRLNEGNTPIPRSIILKQKFELYLMFFCILLLLGIGLSYALTNMSIILVVQVAGASIIGTLPFWLAAQFKFRKIADNGLKIINDPLATYIYTGRTDAYGVVLFAQLAQRKMLKTALGRFGES